MRPEDSSGRTKNAKSAQLPIQEETAISGHFAHAYEQNPQAAVAQLRYLFNTHWNAEATFSQDGFDVACRRVPND